MDDIESFRPVIPVPDLQSSKRPCANLRVWRVLPALAVAPMLGSIVLTLLVGLLDGIFGDETRLTSGDLTILLFAPSLWSTACGLGYLLAVTRVRGQLARYECLLLGCGSGFLALFILAIGSTLIFRADIPPLNRGDIGFFAMAGLFALPFGLFGGWVFWRFGVQPAPLEPPIEATTFD